MMTSACSICLRLASQMKFTYWALQPCQNSGCIEQYVPALMSCQFSMKCLTETTCGGQVILSWSHQMVSCGIIPKAGSIVCSETAGRWTMNSQPEATGLLQKIKNAIDAGKKTVPRIFLAHNSRIQLSRHMFSCKKNRSPPAKQILHFCMVIMLHTLNCNIKTL